MIDDYSKVNLCVNVTACSRPRYLYVCLDAIFRNTIKPDVYVYIDRTWNPELIATSDVLVKQNVDIISQFPVRGIFINKEHIGIGRQFWNSVERAFSMGYNMSVNIEEDWLITSNAIEWLYSCPKIAPLYSLYRWTYYLKNNENGEDTILKNGEYLSWCVGFTKGGFEFINNIVNCGVYRCGLLGNLDNLPLKQRLSVLKRIDDVDWNRILMSIAEQYRLIQIVPPVSLLAHFGNRTSIIGGYGSGTNVEDEMFAGEKEHWLDNITDMFSNLAPERLSELTFAPVDFRYK